MGGGSRCPGRYRVLVRGRTRSKDGENHLALAADDGSDRLRSKSLGDVSAPSFTSRSPSFTSRLPRVRQSSRVLSESASASTANLVAMCSRSPGAMRKPVIGAASQSDLAAASEIAKQLSSHSTKRKLKPLPLKDAVAPQNKKAASHAVRLRLQRVDFQTISAIDQVGQTFAARIFVIFDIPADAVNDTLLAGLNEEKGPFRSARHSK